MLITIDILCVVSKLIVFLLFIRDVRKGNKKEAIISGMLLLLIS